MENVVHSTEVLQVLEHSPGTMAKPESVTAYEIPGSSLDLRFDIGFNEKLEYSKNLTPTNQSKKELYIKLDEILITSLHESFEVYPGSSVDRLEMVEFLSSVVRRNIPAFPDLEKIMCLRDTVLTARVKRAFPEVEYKRKQIRQDHFRKAWLYVNIRRKPRLLGDKKVVKENTASTEVHQRIPANSHSVVTAGIWTPELPKTQQPIENRKRRQTPLNTQLSPSHSPPLLPTQSSIKEEYTATSRSGQHRDKSDSTSSSSKSSPSLACGPVSMVTGYSVHERSAVVLDNYTITKWVKSNYVEDNTSYVPVQDVVKAFKISYGIDITYKECHQMIYSAFTSPRQRTCPLKTVRVSSLGAQYVYRGIAPIADEKNNQFDEDSYTEDSSPEPLPHNDPIQEEREEVWRKLVEEIKQERDQAVMDRNQALSALMDLEKDHAHALTVIDQLRKELEVTAKSVDGSTGNDSCVGFGCHLSKLSPSNFERFSESSASKAENNILSALAPTCEKCSSGKQAYERLKEERDRIWREIVNKATLEKEEAKKRVEVVKRERDSYLERLHAFEKENQQLRDSVPCSPQANINSKTNVMSTLRATKIESRVDALRSNLIKNNHSNINKNSRDSLNSVLSHLRSKRKQSTPTKFSKVPRLSNSESDGQVESSLALRERVLTPTLMDSGNLTLDDVFSRFNTLDRSQASEVVASNCANNIEGELCKSPESFSADPKEMLLYFEGSDMVAFKPHPMEN